MLRDTAVVKGRVEALVAQRFSVDSGQWDAALERLWTAYMERHDEPFVRKGYGGSGWLAAGEGEGVRV